MQEQNQVKIKRVTQSFEVCEVNGFVFKRRRQTIVPENAHPNQAHPALQQHFQTPGAGHQTMMHRNYNNQHSGYAPQQQSNHNSYAPPSVSLNFDEYAISRELYQRLSLRLGALTEDATPAERLGAYVDAVCDGKQLSIAAAAAATTTTYNNNNNGEEHNNPQMEAAVQDVLTMFRKSVVTALKMGTITCLDGPPSTPATGGKSGAGNNDGNDYENDHHAHLEARKAGLRARLARFEQEEQEWRNLLTKVKEMQGELESQAAAALEHTHNNNNNNNINNNDMDEDGQQQRQQEENENNAAEEVDPPEAKDLRQLQADVHRELALQVEGLCMLVGDVEELADAADQSAHAMQAQYHAEKFKTFAHMDSPERLIRNILRPAAVGREGLVIKGGVEEEGKVDGDGDEVKEEEEEEEEEEMKPLVKASLC